MIAQDRSTKAALLSCAEKQAVVLDISQSIRLFESQPQMKTYSFAISDHHK